MKKSVYFILIFTAILLEISCKHKTVGETLNIEVNKTDSLFLSQVADSITYIQLETNEKSLLGNIKNIQYRNGIYYILDRSSTLYLFDDKGSFIDALNKGGKNRGEYLDIQTFNVDSAGNIHILDLFIKKILEYSKDLEFVSETRFEDYPRDFYVVGNRYILYMPDKNIDCRRGLYSIDRETGKYSKIFKILSKQEVPCLLNSSIIQMENNIYSIMDNTLQMIYYMNKDNLLTTLYLKGKGFGTNSKKEFVIVSFLDYEKALFIYFAKQDNNNPMRVLYYNKITKENHVSNFIINDIDNTNGIPTTITNENRMVNIIPSLTNGRSIDNNPVLQIIHLKK
jgi:hypothetical protein